MVPSLKVQLKERGIRAVDIAKALGIDRSQLTRWSQTRVPAERCADVEHLTGIPRATMRPDVFRRLD